MSLRAKLIVAFLFLSVVPLTVIVLYNYSSSLESLRSVALNEVTQLTAEIGERVDSIREEVDRGVERLSTTRLRDRSADGDTEELFGEIGLALGPAAPFVESLEFVPVAPLASEPEIAEVAGEGAPREARPAAPASPVRSVVIALSDVSSALSEVGEISEQWLAGDEGNEAAEEIQVQAEVTYEELARQWAELELENLVSRAEARAQALQHQAEAERSRQLERQEHEGTLRHRVLLVEPVEGNETAITWKSDLLEQQEAALLEQRAEQGRRVLGREFDSSIELQGRPIGRLRAAVSAEKVLAQVLRQAQRDRGEIPFAIDGEGRLYVSREQDRAILEQLPISPDRETSGEAGQKPEDWVIVRVRDTSSDLVYGIARPIGQSLRELRRTAGRNFVVGLGIVIVALAGIAPLSRRITRDLHVLSTGAARLATGDLAHRVPVRSRDEVGELARTFNQMASDLEQHQARLLEGERLRKEQELERRLLEAENRRKGRELEDARQFQLSLLPERVPEYDGLEIGARMWTATEVGGDYYDFARSEDDSLVVVIGDATGHGARAGTMVTVIKSLFSAQFESASLAGFLDNASRAIRRMQLGRMAMALALARYRDRVLVVAAAGMPPILVHRRTSGSVEEVAFEGLPLGSMPDFEYSERSIELEPGDTILLMSDGLPELANERGEPLGYEAVHDLFAAAADHSPDELIAHLSQAAEAWAAGAAPSDDITFVAMRVKA